MDAGEAECRFSRSSGTDGTSAQWKQAQPLYEIELGECDDDLKYQLEGPGFSNFELIEGSTGARLMIVGPAGAPRRLVVQADRTEDLEEAVGLTRELLCQVCDDSYGSGGPSSRARP